MNTTPSSKSKIFKTDKQLEQFVGVLQSISSETRNNKKEVFDQNIKLLKQLFSDTFTLFAVEEIPIPTFGSDYDFAIAQSGELWIKDPVDGWKLFATLAIASNIPNYYIYPIGQLQIFKLPPNTNDNVLEIGDYVRGVVEGIFIHAKYIGGSTSLLASYQLNSDEPL